MQCRLQKALRWRPVILRPGGRLLQKFCYARVQSMNQLGSQVVPPSREIEAPLLVVEVLSPSTRTHDLGRKLPDYRTLDTVQEIWLADSERRWLQLWRRDGERWVVQDFVGGSRFSSDVLAIDVPLDEVYANSGL